MNNELFSRLKDLAQKENRAWLAVLLGAAAMLLILLSELFTPSGKTAAASAAPADDNIYRQQLEQQLSDLIAQVEGAGKTTVMITLESGEETIYALDTLSVKLGASQIKVSPRLSKTLQVNSFPCCAPEVMMRSSTSGWKQCCAAMRCFRASRSGV